MEKTAEWFLAVSKAGHDKGSVFAAKKADEVFCEIMDGKSRTLKKPKKKKLMHVQCIFKVEKSIREMLDGIENDADIRRVLSKYKQGRQAV